MAVPTNAESAQMRDRFLQVTVRSFSRHALTQVTAFSVFESLTFDQAMQAVKDEQIKAWLRDLYDVAAWQLERGAI